MPLLPRADATDQSFPHQVYHAARIVVASGAAIVAGPRSGASFLSRRSRLKPRLLETTRYEQLAASTSFPPTGCLEGGRACAPGETVSQVPVIIDTSLTAWSPLDVPCVGGLRLRCALHIQQPTTSPPCCLESRGHLCNGWHRGTRWQLMLLLFS